MRHPIKFLQPWPVNFLKGTCVLFVSHVTTTRMLLLAGERKQVRYNHIGIIQGKEHLRGFVPARNGDILSSPRPAWLPFKEFRSMQTLGIYKGPDVLLPRRNQLRIPSGEFTCGRDKPRCKTRFPKF